MEKWTAFLFVLDSALAPRVRPLPGASELLALLTAAGIPWAIATSGRWDVARPVLDTLCVLDDIPIVTRDQAPHAKPDSDLFLAAAERPGRAWRMPSAMPWLPSAWPSPPRR